MTLSRYNFKNMLEQDGGPCSLVEPITALHCPFNPRRDAEV